MFNHKFQVILHTKSHGFCVLVWCIPGTNQLLLSYIQTQWI